MVEYILDFTKVKTFLQFYEVLIKGLEFPDWCGKNADAIWDLMTGLMDAPAIIYVKGINKLPKSLHRDLELILAVFDDTTEYYKS